MSLATPQDIQTLQRKLYLKAKREATYRFYSLYDKVCRADILAHAYALSKSNGGATGVDGVGFDDIEAYGRQRFLTELRQELQERRYKPEAVRRVMIPKANGGERPLGIPTVKDRVVQTAVKMVLESIFEADFTDNAYGYRPDRNAIQAVREVHGSLKAGYVQVVDADLSRFFDTIPHADLLKSVSRRVSDGAVLHLIKMWLKTPVEEQDESGKRVRRCTGNRGTPQGGVISPLLANIYTPSAKAFQRLKGKLRRMTDCRMTWQDVKNVVRDVNRVIRGWVNYFSYGSRWKKFGLLERFLSRRIRGWLVRKHKVGSRGECRFPPAYIYEQLGLVNPTRVLTPSRMF